MNEVSELQPSEAEKVRKYLEGIQKTLSGRRGISDRGTLMAEEETVLNSLIYPDRGDVKVTFLKDKKESFVMLNNARDPGNPFVIMSYEDQRHFSARRALNPSFRTLKEGEYGLFISSVQDRELLANTGIPKYFFYSIQFLQTERREVIPTSGTDALKNKPLAECTKDEKFIIFQKKWDYDSRLPEIQKELFNLEVMFAKYKMPVKKEIINIEPSKMQANIAQMIRDAYPYNIRVVLRKDFPADHEKKMQEVLDVIRTVIVKLEEKLTDAGSGDYAKYLNDVIKFTRDILEKDPKLERV